MKKFIYISATILGLAATAAMKAEPGPRISFEALESYPEGIAYNKNANVYYVSSARLGNIGKVTPEGSYTILHGDTSLKSTYGLTLHPDGKRLFACAGDANYSKYTNPATRMKMARLISIDVATGRKLSDVDLSALLPGKHFVNDITFDNQGNAYVTDSFAGAVYKVNPQGKPCVFCKSDQFKTEGVGLNGIVYHSGGFLLVDNSSRGQLFKIDLKDPSKVSVVETGQFFMGADGLVLNDPGRLTVVVNGGNDKIYQLTSTDNWKSAKVSAATHLTDRFTYPSTATLNGVDVWVMNSQFSQLLDSNAVPVKTFAMQKAVFKPVRP